MKLLLSVEWLVFGCFRSDLSKSTLLCGRGGRVLGFARVCVCVCVCVCVFFVYAYVCVYVYVRGPTNADYFSLCYQLFLSTTAAKLVMGSRSSRSERDSH